MNAPRGTLIAYATQPGNTASDGSGRNGLYTGILLKNITNEDESATAMFQKVRSEVMTESKGAQVPWESTSLTDEFFFKPSEQKVS